MFYMRANLLGSSISLKEFYILSIHFPPAGCGTGMAGAGSAAGTGTFFIPRVPSQKTNIIVIQKNNTLNEMTFAANPIVWVYAQGELSRMTSLTCQNNLTDDRIYPINPIIHVKAVANMIRAYWDLAEIFPYRIGPISFAPFNMMRLIVVPINRQDNVPATCGIDSPIRTFAGMK